MQQWCWKSSVLPQNPLRIPKPAPQPVPRRLSVPTYCGPPSRTSSPSVPGQGSPTRVVVPLCTHLRRAAEPQEFALGPLPTAPRPGSSFLSVPTYCGPPSRRSSPLVPCPQRPDQGHRSSSNPPTAGRRAAGVRPQSLPTAPRPGSSFIPQPTYCGPPSRRSSPSVPGHSAPNQGRRSSPYSPTAGRRAAGVHPQSRATAPGPGSFSTPYPPAAGR